MNHPMQQPILQVQAMQMDVGSADGLHRVLHDISFALHEGERIALRGPSGAGKTSLLMALMGFSPISGGSIDMLGRPAASPEDFIALRGPVGTMFQNPDDQLFCPTVIDDVRFGPLNQGRNTGEATAQALHVLDMLKIGKLAALPCSVLSGGQKRLVALAGILAMQPRLLLLDEPTSSLDDASAALVIQALLECNLPILFTTHDAACEAALATRSLHMEAGALRA